MRDGDSCVHGAPVNCPACDVDGRAPLDALAVGVALGVAYRDIHTVTEAMCPDHRSQWFRAMVRAGRTVDDAAPDPTQ